jgi:hypothetical protein
MTRMEIIKEMPPETIVPMNKNRLFLGFMVFRTPPIGYINGFNMSP